MTGPNWKLEDDLKTVTVTFPTDPPVVLKITTSDIDDMLENLGVLRASMLPPHPPEWAVGQTMGVIPNPRWTTEPDALLGNSLLHIRDPRFGWQHYMIPKEEARKLGEVLQKQADAPPPLQESDRQH
jgi:hypothetical protein